LKALGVFILDLEKGDKMTMKIYYETKKQKKDKKE
jgi:hypothetical protein